MASIFKYTTLVLILSLTSRGLGFLRDFLLVNKLGVDIATDSFFAASGIVESLMVLSGLNAMKSVATTTFTQERSKSSDTSTFLSSLIYSVIIYGLLVGLPALLAPRTLTHILVPGFSGERVKITAYCIRIMSLLIMVKSLSLILGSLLGVRRKFIAQNIFTSFMNFVALGTIVFSSPSKLVYNLSWALVLSYLFASTVQYFILSTKTSYLKIVPFKIIWENVIKFSQLAYPLLFVTAAFSLAGMVDKMIGSFFHGGVITSLGIAYNVCFRSIAIILTPMASVYFPHFSRLYFNGQHKELERDFNKGQLTMGLFLIPVGIFLVFFSDYVISAIYLSDKIAVNDIKTTSKILSVYGVALIFHTAYFLPSYLFQGAQKNMVVGKVGIIVYVTNIICSIVFSYIWGYIGIPMGTAAAFFVYSWLLVANTKKHFALAQSKKVWFMFGAILIISLITVAVVRIVPTINISINFIPNEFTPIIKLGTTLFLFAGIFGILIIASTGKTLYSIIKPTKN